MIDSTSDWDANIPKHFVRYKGWLPACMEIKNQVGSTPIKYFTLCAKQAIDIFMLEKEKIIRRDDKNKLPNVIICEKIPSDAAEIYSLVRPPLKEAIIIGDLTKIMNSPELDTSNIENIKSRKQREENRNRKSYERLKGYFPFDIINLDPYGNFLAPPPDQNPLCGVLDKFLEIQAEFKKNSFLLLLTTPLQGANNETLEYFDSEYKSNIDSDSEIQEAAIAKHNSDKFSEISDRSTMLSIGFIKSVVLKKAKYYNWKCDIKEIIHYNSPGNQPLMSSVFHLSTESSSDKIEEEYVKQVIQLIDGQPIQYLPGNEELNNEIKNHLDQILEYREKV